MNAWRQALSSDEVVVKAVETKLLTRRDRQNKHCAKSTSKAAR